MSIAYVLINSELGKEESIIKELRNFKEIKEVHFIYGVYDIIAKVEAEDTEKLKEMIAFKIRRLKDIRSTLTLTAVEGV